ncbi:hypothetical protein BBJ29_000292 [Phytophthora kernoviae]|uniref:Ubiquitin-like domain-containing protein n=1 Tax=Phytophthora kernoviae TaxID=325452 RepID=A0A3F2S090_9STRA|nr:hypothetical protein BBJ29_000292 [Phytophthora kernoviae]RLN67730.1 hypothetical protein BBP00_00001446 [Phytophthora kernoviae]
MPPKKKSAKSKGKSKPSASSVGDTGVEETSVSLLVPWTSKTEVVKNADGHFAMMLVTIEQIPDSAPPMIIEADPVHYVTLDMRQQIQKQHGPISDLKICKGHFSEANELLQDMNTLAEFGIEGAPEGEPEVVCLIHYDFKPEQHDNPLLLATERN